MCFVSSRLGHFVVENLQQDLTNIQGAHFSTQSSIDFLNATLGVSDTGAHRAIPVVGQVIAPSDNHFMMALLSYLNYPNELSGSDVEERANVQNPLDSTVCTMKSTLSEKCSAQ